MFTFKRLCFTFLKLKWIIFFFQNNAKRETKGLLGKMTFLKFCPVLCCRSELFQIAFLLWILLAYVNVKILFCILLEEFNYFKFCDLPYLFTNIIWKSSNCISFPFHVEQTCNFHILLRSPLLQSLFMYLFYSL